MSYRIRNDFPGSDHHVMNRGVGRRTIFERRGDFRYFLALLAWLVKDRTIEVHAFTLLPTHFHLLLRSLQGHLSDAMGWMEDLYVRRFNRSRGRQGPLFESRYRSRRIEDHVYWTTVVRYIDRNPVKARLAAHAWEYPYGSAFAYGGGRSPPWLERGRVEEVVQHRARAAVYCPMDYRRHFGDGALDRGSYLVERRILQARGCHEQDALSELIEADLDRVRDWMQARSSLADGTAAAQILIDPDTLVRVVVGPAAEPTPGVPEKRRDDARDSLLAGLLRTLSGLTLGEIGQRTGAAVSSVHARVRRHVRAVAEDRAYAAMAAAAVREALDRDFPEREVFFETNRLRSLTRMRGG